MATIPERICLNEEILAKLVDGEAIFVNPGNGMYYSMERVGAAAWGLLAQGHSLAEVAQTLSERYDVSAEQAHADLEKLVSELLEAEIVRGEAGASPPAPPAPSEADRLAYAAPALVSYSDLGDLLALDPPVPSFGDVSWEE